jgi:hypothetical protein
MSECIESNRTNHPRMFLMGAAVIVVACLVVRLPVLANVRWAAIAVLVALSVALPTLYFACFAAGKMSRRLVRVAFLACFGLWLTSIIVPVHEQGAVEWLFALRYLKWPLVVYLEVQIAWVVWRVVFKQKRSMDDAMREVAVSANLPGWVVRLAELEGRMWRWLGSKILRPASGRRSGHSTKSQPAINEEGPT